uniref:Uncharacterized protein n=1 Tax=Cacopsylla melanoneura TaxID=428564 RepID=A0A8D9A8X1_9HEMI
MYQFNLHHGFFLVALPCSTNLICFKAETAFSFKLFLAFDYTSASSSTPTSLLIISLFLLLVSHSYFPLIYLNLVSVFFISSSYFSSHYLCLIPTSHLSTLTLCLCSLYPPPTSLLITCVSFLLPTYLP